MADFKQSSGKIVFLRAHDIGTGFGPPTDFIDGEVVFILDGDRRSAFGFQLRNDNNQPVRKAMFELLSGAFVQNLRVTVEYFIDPGKKNGRASRVSLAR